MNGYKFFDPAYDDFLMHYGTKGMKHGIRNYQFLDGTWTELGKERRRVGDGRQSASKPVDNRLERWKDSKAFSDSIWNDVKEVNNSVIFSDFNIMINPFRRNNCGFCAVAYALRRDGYDVKAKATLETLNNLDIEDVFGTKFEVPSSSYMGSGLNVKACSLIKESGGKFKINGDGSMEVNFDGESEKGTEAKAEALFREVRKTTFTTPEIQKIEKDFVAQGNGAKGIMGVDWASEDGMDLSGHWFNYEVNNGRVYIVDSQVRNIYGSLKPYLKYAYNVTYLRTDNTSVNEGVVGDLFHKKFKGKRDELKMSFTTSYGNYLQHEGVGMTTNDIVSYFRKTFPDLEITNLRRVGDWYVFTVGNAPKGNNGRLQGAIDPYIGYNVKTKKWDRVSPPMLGVQRFFAAKPIPF